MMVGSSSSTAPGPARRDARWRCSRSGSRGALIEEAPDLVQAVLQPFDSLLQRDQLGSDPDHLAARRQPERTKRLVCVLLHALLERTLGRESLVEVPAER